MQIHKPEDAERAVHRVEELLDAHEYAAAIDFADSCEGDDRLLAQARAIALTHGGEELQDEASLGRAILLWRELGGETDSSQGYNLANAEGAAWRLASTRRGFPSALADSRVHLHRARALYRRAADDRAVSFQLRLQALVNLGNSYDELGRDADALRIYGEALEMDAGFAMAHGNVGTTLLGIAPLMGGHHPRVLLDAAQALDAALADPEQVKRFGGQGALISFQQSRSKIDGDSSEAAPQHAAEWTDPYLGWCATNGLFLHVSPSCISETVEDLDPLFIRGLVSGFSEEEQEHVYDLIDAFNVLKQDYIAARYLLWLASDPDSLIHTHATAATKRSRFVDTYRYGDWGVRSGLAAQAFAAAINLLDKVAGVTHLYFNTRRKSTRVYFHNLWRADGVRRGSAPMDPELAAQFDRYGNRGLMALCDLSCDLEQNTPLNRMVERRHSATHRFLAVHWMLGDLGSESEWLDHVEWDDLVDGAVQQLAAARAALIYLARLIDIAERLARVKREQEAGHPLRLGELPVMRAEPIDFN